MAKKNRQFMHLINKVVISHTLFPESGKIANWLENRPKRPTFGIESRKKNWVFTNTLY